MEMAKVTSKGQITIPVSIRRRLCIEEGDKLLFIDSPEGVIMVNPNLLQGGKENEAQNEAQLEEESRSPSAANAPSKKKVMDPGPSRDKVAASPSKVTPPPRVPTPSDAKPHSSVAVASSMVTPPPKAASPIASPVPSGTAQPVSAVAQPYNKVTPPSETAPQLVNSAKPAAQQVNGLDIGALLDEIRLIGSKI